MRIWKNHLEVSSVGKFIFAAAIILVGVALSTSALGAGRRVGGFSDGGGLAGGQFRGAFGADKFNDREAALLTAAALPGFSTIDSIGFPAATTVTMAIVIGKAIVASQPNPVVATD